MNRYSQDFDSVTIFILATNETYSLKQTVFKLQNSKHINSIKNLIIVTKNNNCPSFYEAEKLIKEYGENRVELYVQKSSCVELCVAELPALVQSSHFVIMVADGEMDTDNIDTFILKAKQHPNRIICASKWHKDSIVKGYGKFHTFGSRLLNTFIGILFNTKGKDLFSIYQIYPLSVYKKLNFDNPGRFAYEYTIKALRAGVEYEEIPTIYIQRTESKSNFSQLKLFQAACIFCQTALRIRFTPYKQLFAPENEVI